MLSMAKTLVMLRGLARGKHHWGRFVTLMEQAFPEKKVIAIDLAGNGDRYKETSPTTIQAAVEDIRQQLQSINLQPPYDVISLSLGGMITLQWLHENQEIEKAIVMNTSHAMLPFYQRMRPSAILTIITSVFLLPIHLRERVIFGLNANKDPDQEVIQQWITLEKAQSVSFRNLINQIKIAKTFTTSLTISNEKALLLASTHDHLVNVNCSKKIASDFNINIQYHPVAGHEISLDDPNWVIDQAKRVLL
jgi:pimeloyl-ACP methyl ester carboxylesterase